MSASLRDPRGPVCSRGWRTLAGDPPRLCRSPGGSVGGTPISLLETRLCPTPESGRRRRAQSRDRGAQWVSLPSSGTWATHPAVRFPQCAKHTPASEPWQLPLSGLEVSSLRQLNEWWLLFRYSDLCSQSALTLPLLPLSLRSSRSEPSALSFSQHRCVPEIPALPVINRLFPQDNRQWVSVARFPGSHLSPRVGVLPCLSLCKHFHWVWFFHQIPRLPASQLPLASLPFPVSVSHCPLP